MDKNLSLVLHGAKDIRLEEMPVLEPGPGEVQLSIRSVGICGSDINYWQNGRIGESVVKSPMIMGHEPSGVVTKLGEGVTHLKVGDRVAIEPSKPCGGCFYCKRGHYNMCSNLKYMASPPHSGGLCRLYCHSANYVSKLPDNVSFDEGALVQPLALGFYGCQRGEVGVGDYVLITGAGPLGMNMVLAAKARGVAKICVTDLIQDRLDFVRKIGADVTVTVGEEDSARETTKKVLEAIGRAPDVGIECSGSEQATNTLIYSTRPRGIIVQVGYARTETVAINLVVATKKELEIRGNCRFANNYDTVIAAISSGAINVKQLVSHRFPLENSLQAFNTAYRREGIKVVIDCQRQTD